jgi:hypothetical protein
MLEARGGVDLGEETVGADGGGEVWFEHLERDVAVMAEILGQIDRGHAAFAERALDAVAAIERRVEPRDQIHGPLTVVAGANRRKMFNPDPSRRTDPLRRRRGG